MKILFISMSLQFCVAPAFSGGLAQLSALSARTGAELPRAPTPLLSADKSMSMLLYGDMMIFATKVDRYSGSMPQDEAAKVSAAARSIMLARDTELLEASAPLLTRVKSACLKLQSFPQPDLAAARRDAANLLKRLAALGS